MRNSCYGVNFFLVKHNRAEPSRTLLPDSVFFLDKTIPKLQNLIFVLIQEYTLIKEGN